MCKDIDTVLNIKADLYQISLLSSRPIVGFYQDTGGILEYMSNSDPHKAIWKYCQNNIACYELFEGVWSDVKAENDSYIPIPTQASCRSVWP